jgi:hypothetical protein
MGSNKQTKNGKAFEFAFANSLYNNCSEFSETDLVSDYTYNVALNHYNSTDIDEQKKFNEAADIAVEHIISLEPQLITPKSNLDLLKIELLSDTAGKLGDVRDVKAFRKMQAFEIGFSNKNNHKALKSNRISDVSDFGKEWVNISCSSQFISDIKPIFSRLRSLHQTHSKWSSLTDKETGIYKPILDALKKEIESLNQSQNIAVPLFKYFLGRKDFYKVIKQDKSSEVEIEGFNVNGNLSITKLALPSKIERLQFKTNSNNRLLLIFDQDWILEFRIHSASSIVEPSLKFDVQLIGNPPIYRKVLSI